MKRVELSLYEYAQRFVGLRELIDKGQDHPWIQWCFSLCYMGINTPDEVPWCSAGLNGWTWPLRLPSSRSAAARSWGRFGVAIDPDDLEPGGNDIVVFNRAGGSMDFEDPGPAHVGIFAGWDADSMLILGANQGNQVSIRAFNKHSAIAIRRLR